MDLSHLSFEEKEELLSLLEEKALRESRRKIDSYFHNREQYPKHIEFFKAGAQYKFRLFLAANRIGKTLAAAFEVVCHLTGEYPDWWEGKRFNKPTDWWICGKDSTTVREILQACLLGPVGNFGTGMIPYDNLDFGSLTDAKKADTAISACKVRHSSGGFSSLTFKTYDSGRTSFEGTARSIWLDEEAPLSVFTECTLRTATDDNILLMTFTPLKGMSDTIMNFLEGSQYTEGPVGVGKWVSMASWDDVPHLSEEAKVIILAGIPPYQRDARTKGIPQLGAGAIYPVPESEVFVKRFDIPANWKRAAGMDVGWKRTAACWFAQDPNTKVLYMYHEYYKGESEPAVHAVGIKAPGDWIPIAIDTAARGRSQVDGETLMQMYKDLGLKLHNADKSVETGLFTCWDLLSSGQIKIFDDCENFKSEYRLYRRDEKGKVVKNNDHLMDAFRYFVMTGRDLMCTEPVQEQPKINMGVSQRYKPTPIVRR